MLNRQGDRKESRQVEKGRVCRRKRSVGGRGEVGVDEMTGYCVR